MTAEKLASAILNKCEIYYGDALISKEAIIEKYLTFFADSLVSEERTVNFALHTGSLCFDVISVIAVALGCLSYNMSSNDDILASLEIDSLVMFRNQRYRWKGIRKESGKLYMLLEQDGKGKNGKATSYLPFEANKHLIKPYYGDSKVTDGRGVRRVKNNREDFLAFAFDVETSEIPTQIDVSVVIVADRSTFQEICKQVRIRYGEDKEVGLLDVVPASYFTSSGEEHQFGTNPTKAEPVLKVAGKISTARDLVLDKHGNKVVGLLVTGGVSLTENGSELADLLRRKFLRFIHVTSPMKAGIGEHILELYDEAEVFACTKEYLEEHSGKIQSVNPFTVELHRQISNIVHNTVDCVSVDNGWDWEQYKRLKNALFVIKQSHWEGQDKEDFIVTAHGLINLFNTAVFSMSSMEEATRQSKINPAVVSPKERIAKLWEIAAAADSMQENCAYIADALEQKYNQLLDSNPKENALHSIVEENQDKKIAIIVPKAYYAEMLFYLWPGMYDCENIICVTGNRFDAKGEYDLIITVGEINNKKFDALQCLSAQSIIVLLYDCETKMFVHRKKKQRKYERQLNAKISGTAPTECDEPENDDDVETETEIRRFSDLDEYINAFNVLDIRKYAQATYGAGVSAPVSEVKFVGTFITGEQIFFSKFYSAVVFDRIAGTVTEKSPDQLQDGDVLVFVKHNDYTHNIVDVIYEKLLKAGRLREGAVEAYEKSQYWKEALREYKEKNGYTYRAIAKQLNDLGSSVQEVTVRQWLVEDSHIVGPRKEITLEYIAMITRDPYLLSDTLGYFEACREVRHDRREILGFIAKAINDKLSGNLPTEGSVLEIVYDNVDNLSETFELESVYELDESVNININIVNTPITEAEVSM